jgi:hypothetical protein
VLPETIRKFPAINLNGISKNLLYDKIKIGIIDSVDNFCQGF